MSQNIFKKLEGIGELQESVFDQQTLLSKLQKELRAYSIFDLMKMQAQLEHECRYLPEKYKIIFKKKVSQHLLTSYKDILAADPSCNMELDIEQYLDFLKWFQGRLDSSNDPLPVPVMYLLCALYSIFIRRKPPHPEGTPFPGGFFVEKVGEEYYCPVRDKHEDNEEAICRFCVARQMYLE